MLFRRTLLIFLVLATPALCFQGWKLSWHWPYALSGDEPHHLVMLFSLVKDGDLVLGNNYDSADLARGRLLSHIRLDHHTYFYYPDRMLTIPWHQVYQIKFDPALDSPATPGGYTFERTPAYAHRSMDGWEEIPIHTPGYPALLAAFFWLPVALDFEHYEPLILLGQLLLYAFALARLREITFRSTAFIVLAGMALPAYYYSLTFYAEGVSAALMLLTLVEFQKEHHWRLGLLLGVLLLIKEVNGPLIPIYILALIWRRAWWHPRHWSRLWPLLAPGLVVLIGMVVRSYWLFGEYRTYIPWETTRDIPARVLLFLISPDRGLLIFTPVLIVSVGALLILWRRQHLYRPLLMVIAVAFSVTLVIAITNAHGPGGTTFAYRTLTPFAALWILPVLWIGPHHLRACRRLKPALNMSLLRSLFTAMLLFLLVFAALNVLNAVTRRLNSYHNMPALLDPLWFVRD
ncbi:MAG: hypothetical protein KDK30_15100 [Leptospiraceae bacterium]|nr:hypothetical protein [Leptospiraceae bacterium]